jgi:hypothetical protein
MSCAQAKRLIVRGHRLSHDSIEIFGAGCPQITGPAGTISNRARHETPEV